MPVEQFDQVPEPLLDDLRELLSLLGREAFYCDELVGGGPWRHVDRVLADAQARLSLPGARLNTRVLRRSWVRQMRLLGYTVEEVAARAGHTDTKMVREVYSRIPRPLGAARSSPWKRGAHLGAQPAQRGIATVTALRPVAIQSQNQPTKGGPSV